MFKNKNTKCPLCKSRGAKDFGEILKAFHFCDKNYNYPINASRLMMCNKCGISYKYPVPDPKQLLNLYSKTSSDINWSTNDNSRSDFKKNKITNCSKYS